MVKHKIEALLFSSGRKMSIEEISRLCRQKQDIVINALRELKDDYEKRASSLMLIEEGNFWKITVREQHLNLVRNIVTETELKKSVVETLAVIAFKYPIKQCDLIKIRTNKAYEHLTELENSGYITRQKHGRTKLIKLTQKFFDYFDLPEEKLKDHFKDFESIARAIGEKEKEVDKIKEDQRKKAEDAKKEDDKIRQEISLLGNEEHLGQFEVYESSGGQKVEVQSSEADVKNENDEQRVEEKKRDEKITPASFDELEKEEPKEQKEPEEETAEEIGNGIDSEPKEKNDEEEPNLNTISDEEIEKEIKKPLNPEMQKRVDKKIEKMLSSNADETSEEEKKPELSEEKAKEEEKEEPKDLIEAKIEEEEKKEKE